MGTPDYISPEQAEDPHSADERSDIYSLGCTLYHLLTGHVPFQETSVVRKIDAHRSKEVDLTSLPVALRTIVLRMMHKVPKERFSTASDVATALEPFCHECAMISAIAPVTYDVRRSSRRPPAYPVWLVVFLASFVFLLGVVVYRIRTDKGELIITADEDVEVSVRQAGKEVTIYDTKSQQKMVLNSGTYDLELKGRLSGRDTR